MDPDHPLSVERRKKITRVPAQSLNDPLPIFGTADQASKQEEKEERQCKKDRCLIYTEKKSLHPIVPRERRRHTAIPPDLASPIVSFGERLPNPSEGWSQNGASVCMLKLHLINPSIRAVAPHQLFVPSHLYDSPLVDDDNAGRPLDRREAMGDDEGGP